MNGKILACAAGLSAAALTGCVEEDENIIVNINNPVPDTVYVPYSNTDSLYRIISAQTDSLNAEREEKQRRRKEQQARNDSVLAVLAGLSVPEETSAPTEEPEPAESRESNYSAEIVDAYKWAYENGITTAPTIDDFCVYGAVTRGSFFNIINNFAVNLLGKYPYEWNEKNSEGTLTRKEMCVVLGRLLFGELDTGGEEYWKPYAKKLQEAGIITSMEPDNEEVRGYLLIILKGVYEYWENNHTILFDEDETGFTENTEK